MSQRKALQEYTRVKAHADVAEANAHKLIQMLMNGALEKINRAKGHMSRNEFGKKGENVSAAISIIGGLQESLNTEKGGAIAENLEKLYEYMKSTLFEASLHNNIEKLNEVYSLMLTVKEGWDGIEAQAEALIAKNLKANENL